MLRLDSSAWDVLTLCNLYQLRLVSRSKYGALKLVEYDYYRYGKGAMFCARVMSLFLRFMSVPREEDILTSGSRSFTIKDTLFQNLRKYRLDQVRC